MGKGSNIRPRKVPRGTYEANWDRIFGDLKDAPLRGKHEPKGTEKSFTSGKPNKTA